MEDEGKRLKSGVIIDHRAIEYKVPKKFVQIFEGEPRLVFKKLEWFGIHPLDPKMIVTELHEITKQYDILAVPKGMLR